MNNSIWFFENVDVFQLLCPHKYNAYKDSHQFYDYKKTDYVYFENDSANKIFLISSGKVRIGYVTESGEEIITSILSKGEIFGEKAILGEEKRNEFAQAIENNTSICIISLDLMNVLLLNDNDFNLKIYKFIGYRFKKLERRIQLMLFKDSKTRLKEFIKELSIDYGFENKITSELVIKHPYSQKEIATLIGISRPTLNILLNQLKSDAYLDFNGKNIVLKKS
ncbi:Crp/Fnr family transcriptional regulator [Flavobacterium sp.]|uniref:Crp/Fnr family transcriptional regulator n=1 Tax=Flavobacterium sp. TaxID=239 RepID=UPI00286D727C|nr:Crp/Fnr family transcriptional regulator [Flavobacterium sp.]